MSDRVLVALKKAPDGVRSALILEGGQYVVRRPERRTRLTGVVAWMMQDETLILSLYGVFIGLPDDPVLLRLLFDAAGADRGAA